MAFFGKFKKDKDVKTVKKGFYEIEVSSIEKLTSDTVKVTLNIPDELKQEFMFIPGQYLNLAITLNGKEEHRAYSICSGPNEAISFAVKSVKNGTVSTWINSTVQVGETLFVSKPHGNFTLKDNESNCVAIAAGSGITPIISIAKALEKRQGKMTLFYGNRSIDSIIFAKELSQLTHVSQINFISGGEHDDPNRKGRINKESFTEEIKANLDILKADSFFICGPEQMILDVANTLKFFGVPDSKVHFELFTTPVLMKSEETKVSSKFEGDSKVKAILDSEVVEFTLHTNGKNLLESIENAGLDAPYSCKGGVCCSCKAKILKGSATMSVNYSLTDQEIKDGYILTCQAHPASEELTVSFDD